MRIWLLVAPCLLLGGCDTAPELSFFGNEAWSTPLQCGVPKIDHAGTSVADLTTVGDSAFAVLYPDERRLVVYDRSLQPLEEHVFDKAGPRGLTRPVSAAITDTAIYVLDEAGWLKRFDRSGGDRDAIPLNFIPRRVRANQQHVFVLPLVAGSSPSSLLFEVRGEEFRQLDVPIAVYEDVGINTFANMASVAIFPDRIALMHEMVVPFGYVVDLRPAATSRRRFAVPIPDAVRGTLNRLPKPPLSEQNVNQLTMVAFAAAPNLRTGSTYYVTRLPAGHGQFQKILVELDSAMQLRRAYPIAVHPHHIVHVGARSSILGVDANSEWFECQLP